MERPPNPESITTIGSKKRKVVSDFAMLIESFRVECGPIEFLSCRLALSYPEADIGLYYGYDIGVFMLTPNHETSLGEIK